MVDVSLTWWDGGFEPGRPFMAGCMTSHSSGLGPIALEAAAGAGSDNNVLDPPA